MTDWRDRLRAQMSARGMTDADIVRATKLNASFMNALWKGVDPKASNLSKIAHAVGLTLGELYEGDIVTQPILEVIGFSGPGDMWSELPPASARNVSLNVLSQDLVSIEVATNEWAPRYNQGDIVCGVRSVGQNLHNLIGRDCIVQTADGGKLIKYLTRGTRKNRFTLKSFMPTADDIQDVEIAWAAPIEFVLRGK